MPEFESITSRDPMGEALARVHPHMVPWTHLDQLQDTVEALNDELGHQQLLVNSLRGFEQLAEQRGQKLDAVRDVLDEIPAPDNDKLFAIRKVVGP